MSSPLFQIWCVNFDFPTLGVILHILGDPGADSGDEGKSKRAEKCGAKKSTERRSLLFFLPYIFFRPILSAPGSPRMDSTGHFAFAAHRKGIIIIFTTTRAVFLTGI